MPELLSVSSLQKSDTHDYLDAVTRIEQPIAIDWALKELRYPRNLSKSLLRRLRPGKHFFARFIWRKVPVDALILALPSHEGRPVDIARQVHHRLVARLVAHKVAKMQSLIIAGSWLVCLGLGAGMFAPDAGDAFYQQQTPYGYMLNQTVYDRHVAEARSFGIMLGAVGSVLVIAFGAAILTRRAYNPAVTQEAEAIIARTFLRTFPAGTPLDLRDHFQQGWLTIEGRPLSAELSAEDGRSQEGLRRTRWWCVTALAVGIAVTSLFMESPFAQSGLTLHLLISSVPLCLLSIIGALKWWLDENPAEVRAKELEQAESAEGATYVAAGGRPWGIIPEAARQQQIVNALRDTSPVVTLGTTTGLFAARGDFYAPNAGLPLSLSFQDLQTHLLVFGGTGSGKTSGILRPIARQFGQHDDIGMVIMDGKGALPAELRDLPSMQLIDPAHHRVSLVAGLAPNIIVDTLVQILQGDADSGKDPFFVNNASSLLRRALTLMQAASASHPDYWTLMNAVRFASNESYRETVLLDIPEITLQQDPMVQEAFTFYTQSWPETEPKTQANILSTLRSWVSTITAERALLDWAETPPHAESGIDLLSCLHGGRTGFCLPNHRYGQAGAVVTALLKARLYGQLKARAETGIPDGETPVLFIIDEAQEVATEEDATMLAIGRSLGLAVVAATQGIEGIHARLGERTAATWLSIYRNVVALAGRSIVTDQFVAQRAGSSWQASLNRIKGLTIRDTLAVEACTGAIAASRRQAHIAEVIEEVDISASFLQRKLSEIAKGVLPNAREQVEVSVGIRPVLEAEELQNLLAEPDTAIALVNRGRVHRRDIIRLHPIYN